ncbi:MAG: Phosphatidylglycerol--prolipoprotein diacylglyceryl transferase [Parachlamydiales bacterium]|nr:Phosphatidylglycerol--prolipoprotein diacylglyceryl transferase [Parachlamydiales bacterium]
MILSQIPHHFTSIAVFHWDPDPDLFIIPGLNWPIKWYGLLFALGFAVGFTIFQAIVYRYLLQVSDCENQRLKEMALKMTDRITLYAVVGTVIGARLGHFIFYENPSLYITHPLEILRVWNGGLASHGAAIGIIAAIVLFSRYSKTIEPGLTWIRLLDFICVPTALAGALIRWGNFINQEILGTKSALPWAVVFGHPADHSFPAPRHPVQLYESFFYLIVFLILWHLSYRRKYLLRQGWLIGLFLILVFGYRFFIEYFKIEQSHLVSAAHQLTMGQWLSIPLVIMGALLMFFSKRSAKS